MANSRQQNTSKPRKPREPMTEAEVEALLVLNACRKKLDESNHKTFVWQMSLRAGTHPERGMTVAQRWWLWDLIWKYRNQIRDKCRNEDDWDRYRRLTDRAWQMREASDLRWTIKRLRDQAATVNVDRQNAETYYVASETELPFDNG